MYNNQFKKPPKLSNVFVCGCLQTNFINHLKSYSTAVSLTLHDIFLYCCLVVGNEKSLFVYVYMYVCIYCHYSAHNYHQLVKISSVSGFTLTVPLAAM